ncbi:hypothetical protein C8R44DRAFT_725080 [Mycena epipterygia]|nr:hypothetical protein C8R44DRAFT_725080 [Mycena epipterygia]
MPSIGRVLSQGVSIKGHNFSPATVDTILFCGGGTVLVLLSYFMVVSILRLFGLKSKVDVEADSTAPACRLKAPVLARLRPDISFPESTLPTRSHLGSSAPFPKARTAGPTFDVYRYPGNCWSQEHSSRRALQGRHALPSPLRTFLRPIPELEVAVNKDEVSKLAQVSEAFSSADVLFVADASTTASPQVFQSWVDSMGPDFKFGHSTAARVSPVKPKVLKAEARLVNWGPIHTLELPLRGNKMARTPFVKSTKLNVSTNVVFAKTSPFYTPTAADKENAPVYAGNVDAVV